MTPEEYSLWRTRLQADYKRLFPPVLPKPRTTLGMGMLFPFTDADAKIGVNLASRAMTTEEWDAYVRSPAGWRIRRPGEEHPA